jgi:hypothetical protein
MIGEIIAAVIVLLLCVIALTGSVNVLCKHADNIDKRLKDYGLFDEIIKKEKAKNRTHWDAIKPYRTKGEFVIRDIGDEIFVALEGESGYYYILKTWKNSNPLAMQEAQQLLSMLDVEPFKEEK